MIITTFDALGGYGSSRGEPSETAPCMLFSSGFNTDINGTRPGSEGSNSTGIKFVASLEGFDSKGHEHGKDVIIIYNTRIMVLVE